MSLISVIETDWNIVKKNFSGFISKVLAAVTYLEPVAEKIIGWVGVADPALGAALAIIVHKGETALETLASHAAAGLGAMIDSFVPDIETTIANAIGASGLNLTGKQKLTAAEVAILNKVASTGHAAIDAALAKVMGAAAPALPTAVAPPRPQFVSPPATTT